MKSGCERYRNIRTFLVALGNATKVSAAPATKSQMLIDAKACDVTKLAEQGKSLSLGKIH